MLALSAVVAPEIQDMNCLACQGPLSPHAEVCPQCGSPVGEAPTRLGLARDTLLTPDSLTPDSTGLGVPVAVGATDGGEQAPTREVKAPRHVGAKAPEILVGRRGRYLVGKPLAKGGMGQVFLAQELDSEPARDLVAKRSIGADQEALARFQREIEIAARIGDPTAGNLVAILDWGNDRNGPFLMMPFYRLGSLHDYVQKHGNLDDVEGLQMARGLAHALQFIHGKNIIHRDIKPANVLVAENLDPHLCDFGIARDAVATITVPGQGIGTKGYTAPEQLAGEVVDVRTDIYSFGATLYFAVTGEHPTRVQEAKIPAPLRPLLLRSLNPKRELRYASATELVDAVRQARSRSATKGSDQAAAADLCPACNTVNHPSAQHCTACGNTLVAQCPRCRRRNRGTLRFCPGCGLSVEAWKVATGHLEAAVAAIEAGQFDAAEQRIGEAKALLPDGFDPAEVTVRRLQERRAEVTKVRKAARKAFAAGELEQAIEGFRALQKLVPKDSEASEELHKLKIELQRRRVQSLVADLEAACDVGDATRAGLVYQDLQQFVDREDSRTVQRARALFEQCREARLADIRAHVPTVLRTLTVEQFRSVQTEMETLGASPTEIAKLHQRFQALRSRGRRVAMLVTLVAVVGLGAGYVFYLQPRQVRLQRGEDCLAAVDAGDYKAAEAALDEGVLEPAAAEEVRTLLRFLQQDPSTVDGPRFEQQYRAAMGSLRQRGLDRAGERVRQQIVAALAGALPADRNVEVSTARPFRLPLWLGAALRLSDGNTPLTLAADGRVENLQEGSRTTSLVFGDGPDRVELEGVRFTVDTRAPSLEVRYDTTSLRFAAIDERGVSELRATGSLAVIEAEAPTPDGRQRELVLPLEVLQPGQLVTVVVADTLGNRGEESHTVSKGGATPIQFELPEIAVRWQDGTGMIEVVGRVDPVPASRRAVVQIGTVSKPAVVLADGRFSEPMPATTSDVDLQIVVEDAMVHTETLQLAPLAIEVAKELRVHQERVAIEVRVTNRRGGCSCVLLDAADRVLDATPVPLGNQVGWLGSIKVPEGTHEVVVEVTDRLGKSARVPLRVMRNSAPPEFRWPDVVRPGEPVVVTQAGGPTVVAVRSMDGASLPFENGAVTLPAPAAVSSWRCGEVAMQFLATTEFQLECTIETAPLRVEHRPTLVRELKADAIAAVLPVAAGRELLCVARDRTTRLQLEAARVAGTARQVFGDVLPGGVVGLPGSDRFTVAYTSGRVATWQLRPGSAGDQLLWQGQPALWAQSLGKQVDTLFGAAPWREDRYVAATLAGQLVLGTRRDPDGARRLQLPPDRGPRDAGVGHDREVSAFALRGDTCYLGSRGDWVRIAVEANGFGTPEVVALAADGKGAAKVKAFLFGTGDLPQWIVTEEKQAVRILPAAAAATGSAAASGDEVRGELVRALVWRDDVVVLTKTELAVLAPGGSVRLRLAEDLRANKLVDMVPSGDALFLFCSDGRVFRWELPR
jgi:hypothetical protein